jgi:hypothetical protein
MCGRNMQELPVINKSIRLTGFGLVLRDSACSDDKIRGGGRASGRCRDHDGNSCITSVQSYQERLLRQLPISWTSVSYPTHANHSHHTNVASKQPSPTHSRQCPHDRGHHEGGAHPTTSPVTITCLPTTTNCHRDHLTRYALPDILTLDQQPLQHAV